MDKSSPRLMVVDDDRLNLDLLARRLERHGYNVVRASRGAQALECLKAGGVHLILLDHKMPDMSGFEVLRQVRQKYGTNALPIIMVTAASDANTVMTAVTLGANDFVTKPVNMTRLLARIAFHLNQT